MTNLIPTPIVDKNGRRTTVHKRPDKVIYDVVAFPPPATSPSLNKEALVRKIVDDIRGLAFIDDGDETDALRDTVGSYSADFLGRVEAALRSPKSSTTPAILISAGEPQSLVSEAMTFLPQIKTSGFHDAVRLISSLHNRKYYPTLPYADDYSVANAEVQSKCLALLKVTTAVQQGARDRAQCLMTVDVGEINVDRVRILKDQRLISYVIEHPELADLISDTIRARGTGDFGVIYASLESESVPLSGGML